jgi:ribosomal protein S18 acetylase RimI-like enzyme
MTIETRDIPKSAIGIIKPLWEALNRMHLEDSVHFKDHYRAFTFGQRLESLLGTADSDIKITVASSAESALGYCVSRAEGAAGEIESLYLDESIRGLGVGGRLIESHIAWMRERGCERIRVGVSHGHDSPLDFYRKHGFRERLTILELKESERVDGGGTGNA